MPLNCLSRDAFSAQLSEIWGSALAKKQIKEQETKNPEELINKCYQLYLNAFHGKLPFMVVGNEKLCESQEERYNFGILATDHPFHPLNMKGPPTEMNQGAILSQTKWCVTLNDSYILGAIHAQKSFHLFEPSGELENNTLWDEKFQRPRVLGRELVMLKAAGYQRVDHKYKILEKAFYPKKSAQNIRLKYLFEAAEKTQSLINIRSFINSRNLLSTFVHSLILHVKTFHKQLKNNRLNNFLFK